MSRFDEEVLIITLDKLISLCDRITKQGLSPWRLHRIETIRHEADSFRRAWKLDDDNNASTESTEV